jgi:hypothetical protein
MAHTCLELTPVTTDRRLVPSIFRDPTPTERSPRPTVVRLGKVLRKSKNLPVIRNSFQPTTHTTRTSGVSDIHPH